MSAKKHKKDQVITTKDQRQIRSQSNEAQEEANEDIAINKSIVNPRVDIAFKKLFGVNENKDLLISLINSIVSEEDQVVSITLLNPYNIKNFKGDKATVLDIKAEDQNGQKYNIEMQITDEKSYSKRALLYWAKLYSEQLGEGQDCSELRKTIGIHILNFLSVPKSRKYHNKFRLTEVDTGIHFFEDMEMHTIELSKFEKDSSITDELKGYLGKVKTALDRWVLFLTKYALLDLNNLPKEISDPAIKKALGTLKMMSFSKEERAAYEEHLKWLRIESSALEKAKDEGRAEGIAEEKKRGEAEAHKKAVTTAKNLLAKKVDIKVIAESLGLTEKEIRALK